MKARYENDTALGPGYGLFVVTDVEADAAARLGFGIRRSSDGRFLAKTGWQDAEEPLWPDETRSDGAGGVVLAVSAAVVNQLDELDPCRFSLYRENSDRIGACALHMAGIAYGNMVAGGSVAGAMPTAKPAPAPVPAPAPPQPEAPAAPESLPQLDPAPPAKKGLPGWVLSLLVGAICLGIGGWMWFSASKPRDAAPAPDVAKEEAKPETKPVEEPKTAAESPKAEAPKADAAPGGEAKTVVLSPKERARVFLREGGSPEAALALSRELPKDSVEGQDATFLLLEVAAEGGNPDAMLGLATYYDPLQAGGTGTLQKDPEQAWRWYAKAATGTTESAVEAKKRLEAMEGWLKEQAGKGDADAEALLNRLKK